MIENKPLVAAPLEKCRISTVSSAEDTRTVDTSLLKLLGLIKEGKWKTTVEEIRAAYVQAYREAYARTNGVASARKEAKKVVAALKKRLPAVLFSGTFTKRSSSDLTKHSGLLCVDIDDADDLVALKKVIVMDKHTLAAFISPTGNGIKVVVRISDDGTEHKNSFLAVQEYYRDRLKITIDPACKDCSRLCFVSYDPDLFINENASPIPPKVIAQASSRPVGTSSGTTPNPVGVERQEAKQKRKRRTVEATEEEIESALAHVSAEEYKVWLDIGMALHSWDDIDGLPLWDNWSKNAESYEEGCCDQKWESFAGRKDGEDSITIGTVFHYAKRKWVGAQRKGSRP
jgi:hypothetical protein